MADTRDVAEELFEFLTGFPYKPGASLKIDGDFVADRLEWLANHCRIGIEDARQLVRLGKDDQAAILDVAKPQRRQAETAEEARQLCVSSFAGVLKNGVNFLYALGDYEKAKMRERQAEASAPAKEE